MSNVAADTDIIKAQLTKLSNTLGISASKTNCRNLAEAIATGAHRGIGSSLSHNISHVYRMVFSASQKEGVIGELLSCSALPSATLLAVYGASERLCLWYRAHEVADANLLCNYFDTAYSYFMEYWEEQEEEEVATTLQSTLLGEVRAKQEKNDRKASTALELPMPTPKELRALKSAAGSSKPSNSRDESKLMKRKEDRSSATTTARKSATTRNSTAKPTPRPPASIPNGSITRTSSGKLPRQHDISDKEPRQSISQSSPMTPRPPAKPQPASPAHAHRSAKKSQIQAVSLNVKLGKSDENNVRRSATIDGSTIEMNEEDKSRILNVIQDGWITLAVGPAYPEFADVLNPDGTYNCPEDDSNEFANLTDSPMILPKHDKGNKLEKTNATYVVDEDESWWQRRYCDLLDKDDTLSDYSSSDDSEIARPIGAFSTSTMKSLQDTPDDTETGTGGDSQSDTSSDSDDDDDTT